jgi:hypothetical protein
MLSLLQSRNSRDKLRGTRLNVSTKPIALLGSALLLLDFSATAVVSAATAASYLAGEVSLPFPVYVGAAFVFVLFTFVSLAGLRESARVATGVLAMHVSYDVSYCLVPAFDHLLWNKVLVMFALIVASFIAWGRGGIAQLSSNWSLGHVGLSPAAIARQVFNGICIGMLGLTGFECECFDLQLTVYIIIQHRCTRIYIKDEAELLSQGSAQLAYICTYPH